MTTTLLSVRRLSGTSGALACAAVLVALAAAACGQVRAPSLAPGGSGDHGVLARGHLRLISGNGVPVAANLRPGARERAIAQVERILARAVVPPGSHLVARLPQLSSPGNEIACNAIEDDTLEWIVPPTADSTSTFLASHLPAGMRSDASGVTSAGGNVTSWLNEGARRSSASSPELIFTWVPVSGGTGLRADALAVPTGAACTSGGPEVSAARGQHYWLPARRSDTRGFISLGGRPGGWQAFPMNISADELELAAAPGWRGCEEDNLGDWLLRAAGGFTGRANSALAVGDPGVPLAEAAEKVRAWYTARGLPALIAVPFPTAEPAASRVDQTLERLGWTIRADAAMVMTADAEEVARRTAAAFGAERALGSGLVQFDPEPDHDWQARYHYRGLKQLPPVALDVLTSAPWQAFASVRSDGRTIAIGRVAGDGQWAGLTAIEVDPRHRRRGLGAAVTAALTAHAASRGIMNIYLQVTTGNAAARALYRRIGFTDHHGYHYRVEPDRIGRRS